MEFCTYVPSSFYTHPNACSYFGIYTGLDLHEVYHPCFATYDNDACVFPWKPYQVNSL